MIADLPELQPGSLPSGTGRQYRYLLYGLHVLSDIHLPVDETADGTDASAELVFKRADAGRPVPQPDGPIVTEVRCHQPCHRGAVTTRVSRGPGGTWLWNESIGTCHILPGGRQVDVYTCAGVSEHVLGLMLLGQVSVFVVQRLGYPTLHASAIVTKYGASVFLGPKGQGKSTMSASFLRRGDILLTDDALPLRAVGGDICGLPSLPLMKVWQKTAQHTLGLVQDLPSLVPNYDKKLYALDGRYGFAQEPVPVRAVYLLDRYDAATAGKIEITIRYLSQREGVLKLLEQTALRPFLQVDDVAKLLPMYGRLVGQAGVRVLGYPSGFEHQGAVYERVMADLGARG